MGTHPIFESDFDCLTEWSYSRRKHARYRSHRFWIEMEKSMENSFCLMEEDTCWNSDQGIPQYIRVTLNDKQKSTKLMLKVQFQGGFCGKESEICFKNGSEEVLTHNFYPKDDNDYQEFMIESEEIEFDNLQITFKSTTDFYGRIIIYQLSLLQL